MKRIYLILAFVLLTTPIYARERNLFNLVDGKILKVYIGDFKSETEKISPELFKETLGKALSNRKKEHFEVVKNKEESDIIVNCDILSFKYLEKDPVDHFAGGTYGLVVDAMVSQNYAQIQAEFDIYRTKDMKNIWHRKEGVSVTQTDMPESESIPKVLNESAKRFIYLCFGKRRR